MTPVLADKRTQLNRVTIQETHDLRVATDVKLAFAKVGEEV